MKQSIPVTLYGYKVSLQQHFAGRGCLTSGINGEKKKKISTICSLQDGICSETGPTFKKNISIFGKLWRKVKLAEHKEKKYRVFNAEN